MGFRGARRLGFFWGGAVVATFALFVTLASSASAATPLSMNGESLTSTSGSASNSESPCPLGGFVNDSGRFVVSGNATGPDPGTFSESGTLAVSGLNYGWLKSFLHVYFNATFTITSPGMLPITGTLSGQGGSVRCFGGAYSLFNMPVSYALTGNYSGSGAAGWPASGALVNATVSTQASVTESFAP